MRTVIGAALPAAAATLLVVSCSGAGPSELFGGEAPTGDGTSDASPGIADFFRPSEAGAGGGEWDGDTVPDDGGEGAPARDASAGVDGASLEGDASLGLDGQVEAGYGDAGSVGGAYPGARVSCGPTLACGGESSCCRIGGTFTQLDDSFTWECHPPAECERRYRFRLVIPCDDALDCRSQGADSVCCVTGLTTLTVGSIRCASASACPYRNEGVNGALQTTLCDPNASTPCPNGRRCRASLSLRGYHVCD